MYCIVCNEKIEKEGDAEYSASVLNLEKGEWTEGDVCLYCSEALTYEPDYTVVYINEEGKFKTVAHFNPETKKLYTNLYILEEFSEYPEEVIEMLYKFYESVSYKLIRIDAWRIALRTQTNNGLVKVLDTWTPTVYDSNFPAVMKLADYYNNLTSSKIPLFFVFSRTSNVFAMGLEVYTFKRFERDLVKLIEKVTEKPISYFS